MQLKIRAGLAMFCIALILTIGLSSLNSEVLLQNNAFAFADKSINQIREQCGVDELPPDVSVSAVLHQFKQNNAFASNDDIIDQIREQCGVDKVPLGATVSDVLEIFKPDIPNNPTQVPIGTPISLVFIAAALQFLPSVL